MSNVCTLPPRYDSALTSDPRLQGASRSLADALRKAPEYQEFLRLAEAVNVDEDVYALVQEIRSSRASFRLAEGGALEAKLETLPVMEAYRASERALRALFAAVDRVVSQAAGVGFCEHVRPQGHG